ncbi:MAG: ribosome recycling factor [Thermodesulfovibrionales bacterium]|nr:ribosome recycling factor [Thermodesulfovibrionales bacterium]
MQDVKKKATDRMNGTINALKKELASIRTGRASLSILDGITVDYYGSPVPINQVATLGIPDSKQIVIQPWEAKLIPSIEKAILKSDLGLTPVNDGKLIRITIPALTEERRKHLAKMVRKKAEEARIAIRNIRRDINEELKKAEKEKLLSEDEAKRLQGEVQKITDSFINKVEEVVSHKEKEIMEV